VKFADLSAFFLDAEGKQNEDAFLPDHLHLTAKGYEIFAKALEPLVAEAMKPPG
jgi:lysophospholipase L1-like esterase